MSSAVGLRHLYVTSGLGLRIFRPLDFCCRRQFNPFRADVRYRYLSVSTLAGKLLFIRLRYTRVAWKLLKDNHKCFLYWCPHTPKIFLPEKCFKTRYVGRTIKRVNATFEHKTYILESNLSIPDARPLILENSRLFLLRFSTHPV
jgi:hypothetical protein